MSDLVEFLKARLDEDFLEANAWRATDDDPGEMDVRWYKVPTYTPARIVAEVEAKRRRLERHQPKIKEAEDEPDLCAWCSSYYRDEPWPCPDLRDDLSVYADHSDFREEWRP